VVEDIESDDDEEEEEGEDDGDDDLDLSDGADDSNEHETGASDRAAEATALETQDAELWSDETVTGDELFGADAGNVSAGQMGSNGVPVDEKQLMRQSLTSAFFKRTLELKGSAKPAGVSAVVHTASNETADVSASSSLKERQKSTQREVSSFCLSTS